MIFSILKCQKIVELFVEEGHRTIFVGVGEARFGIPDDEDDGTYNGNKSEKYIPSAFTYIVKTANTETKAGKEECQVYKT